MIIPLGFGRSLPEKPWLSLTVCALISIVSFPFMEQFSKIDHMVETSDEAIRLLKIQTQFTQQNCENLSGQKKACEVVLLILQGRIRQKVDKKTDPKKDKDHRPEIEKPETKEFASLNGPEKVLVENWLTGLQNPEKFEHIVSLHPADLSALIAGSEVLKKFEMHEYAKLGILTPESKSFRAGFLSFLTHSGWLHLLGNMLILFFFLRMLEPRFPRLGLLIVLILGGVGGLFFELWAHSKDVPVILGASAGVTAIIGCFWATYFFRQVQVAFLEPTSWVARQKIFIPISWSIPVLVLLVDLIGALNSRIEGSHVAHLAHISGFMIGAFSALILKLLFPLPKGVLFPKEFEYLFQIRTGAGSSQEILDLCEKVIDWNPEQLFALRAGLRICFQGPASESQFVLSRFPDFLGLCQKKKLDEQCLQIFKIVPAEFNLIKVFERTDLATLNWLGRIFLDSGDWWRALQSYTVVAEKFATQKSSSAVYVTIQKLVSFSLENPEHLPVLASWFQSIEHPVLKQLIESDFPQISAFEKGKPETKRVAG